MTTLAERQAILQRELAQVRVFLAEYGLDSGRLDELAPLIEHFEIRLPFIGAFSCGKSSLINALLNEKRLATAITPETAVPAELRFAPQERVDGCLPDGRRLALTAEDLRENRLESLAAGGGWVEVQLPNPALRARPQLVLVDMPGWDSGAAAHKRVIDDYAHRSLAYCVVMSVEDGALRDSLRRALLELGIQQMPIVLVVSKADKQTPDNVNTVVTKITGDISTIMGQPPLAVAVTSARKSDIQTLEAALDALQARAQDIFESRVVAPFREILNSAAQRLGMLADQENTDAARIQADIEKFEHELRAFDQRLTQETDALEQRLGPILGAIRLRVENRLATRLDLLVQRVLSGQDVADDILGTARLEVSKAVQEEFEPALRRYFDRLVDALPSRLDFSVSLKQPDTEDTSADQGEFRWKDLGTTLAPFLIKAIPHPVVKAIAALLPLFGALLDSQAAEERRSVAEARRREVAQENLRVALDDAVRQIEDQLRPALEEQVQKAKEEVARNVESERKEIINTLTTLSAALEQGEAETAALRQRARLGLERISAWQNELARSA